MFTNIETYIKALETMPFEPSEERRSDLLRLAQTVADRITVGEKVSVLYVCTHNSRRSVLGQIWAKTIANYLGISGVESYSGGTEITRVYDGILRTFELIGFNLIRVSEGNNPTTEVWAGEKALVGSIFSKHYNDNPTTNRIALMMCNEADAACPFIPGAMLRVSTPFLDPKWSDGKQEEEEAYLEASSQIALETFFWLSATKNLLIAQ